MIGQGAMLETKSIEIERALSPSEIWVKIHTYSTYIGNGLQQSTDRAKCGILLYICKLSLFSSYLCFFFFLFLLYFIYKKAGLPALFTTLLSPLQLTRYDSMGLKPNVPTLYIVDFSCHVMSCHVMTVTCYCY